MTLDVILVVFREAQVQPPKNIGGISDVILTSEFGIGTKLNDSVGDKIVQIRVPDLPESLYDDFKECTKELKAVDSSDPFYLHLTSGKITVTNEQLQPYIVEVSNA